MSLTLEDQGRRVLAHLPVPASALGMAEDELVKEEGGPESSVRSYDLQTFAKRLAEDRSINPILTESQVEGALNSLTEARLASKQEEDVVEQDENGDNRIVGKAVKYRMTQEGFDALHAPQPENQPQVPGKVFIEVHPGEAVADMVSNLTGGQS